MIYLLCQKCPRVITRIQLNIWTSSLVRRLAFWEKLPSCFSTADAKLTSSLQSLPFDRCLICCIKDAKVDKLYKPLGRWKQRPSNCYPETRYSSLCNANMSRKRKVGVVCKILQTGILYLSTEIISSILHVVHFFKNDGFCKGQAKNLRLKSKMFLNFKLWWSNLRKKLKWGGRCVEN